MFNDRMSLPLLLLIVGGRPVPDEMNESTVELVGGSVMTTPSLEVDELGGKSIVDELIGRSMDKSGGSLVDEPPGRSRDTSGWLVAGKLVGRSKNGVSLVDDCVRIGRSGITRGVSDVVLDGGSTIDEMIAKIDERRAPSSSVVLLEVTVSTKVGGASRVGVGALGTCESSEVACADLVRSLRIGRSGRSGVADVASSLEIDGTTVESTAAGVDGALSVLGVGALGTCESSEVACADLVRSLRIGRSGRRGLADVTSSSLEIDGTTVESTAAGVDGALSVLGVDGSGDVGIDVGVGVGVKGSEVASGVELSEAVKNERIWLRMLSTSALEFEFELGLELGLELESVLGVDSVLKVESAFTAESVVGPESVLDFETALGLGSVLGVGSVVGLESVLDFESAVGVGSVLGVGSAFGPETALG